MTQQPDDQHRAPNTPPETPPVEATKQVEERVLNELAVRLLGLPAFQSGIANGVKSAMEGMNLGTVISRSVNAAIDQRVAETQNQEKQQTGAGSGGAGVSHNPAQLGELAGLFRMLGLGGGSGGGGDLAQLESVGKMMGSLFNNVLGPIQQVYDAGRRDYAGQLTIMARAGLPITVEGLEATATPPNAPATPSVAHQQQELDFGAVIKAVAHGIRFTR